MTDIWWPTAFSNWGDAERDAIARVVKSDRLTMGPEVVKFEREFADYHGRKHGIMVNSGSSANLVAIAALCEYIIPPADRVAVVPALAWSTTYAPLVQYGFGLKLADADNTWCAPVPDIDEKAVLYVSCPILGNPAYSDGWGEIADSGLLLLEDCCESLGAAVNGTKVGRLGDISTFSFFYSHQISAIEGGMVLTDDDYLAKMCRMLRAHGWTRDVTTEFSDFDHEYDFRVHGYNVRPDEIRAAVASVQLKGLDQSVRSRYYNYCYFKFCAKNLPIEFPHQLDDTHISPFGMPFLTRDNEERKRLAGFLRAHGIDCRPPTGGSYRLHKYGWACADQSTPNADDIHRRGMFIGCPPWPAEQQIERVCYTLHSFYFCNQ